MRPLVGEVFGLDLCGLAKSVQCLCMMLGRIAQQHRRQIVESQSA